MSAPVCGVVVVIKSRPAYCVVCGGRQVDTRCADDPDARPQVIDCPHCGPLELPAVYSWKATA